MKRFRIAASCSVVVLLAALSLGAGTCGGNKVLIQKVSLELSENLENLKVALTFGPQFNVNLSAIFPVKDYGSVFLNAWTSEQQPFQVGFNLRTTIVNDQEYIRFEPQELLPNGAPIGLDRTFVQVHGAQPIDPKFDLSAYVDVLHADWLGAAVVFLQVDTQVFPQNAMLSQVFKRDSQDRPMVVGSVFGPSLDGQGQLQRQAGAAVFVKFSELRTLGPQKLELTAL